MVDFLLVQEPASELIAFTLGLVQDVADSLTILNGDLLHLADITGVLIQSQGVSSIFLLAIGHGDVLPQSHGVDVTLKGELFTSNQLFTGLGLEPVQESLASGVLQLGQCGDLTIGNFNGIGVAGAIGIQMNDIALFFLFLIFGIGIAGIAGLVGLVGLDHFDIVVRIASVGISAGANNVNHLVVLVGLTRLTGVIGAVLFNPLSDELINFVPRIELTILQGSEQCSCILRSQIACHVNQIFQCFFVQEQLCIGLVLSSKSSHGEDANDHDQCQSQTQQLLHCVLHCFYLLMKVYLVEICRRGRMPIGTLFLRISFIPE